MNGNVWLRRLMIAIALITIASGAAQWFFPEAVLRILHADTSPASVHFFAIVGMFMLGFGGVFLQTLLSPSPDPTIAMWAALQKYGAVVMVTLGVVRGLFVSFALAVAVFDLVSAVLMTLYWRRIAAVQRGRA